MDLAQVIQARRAVNYFDPKKPVDENLLRRMVELASMAPSSFNLQPWSLIVVTDQEEKDELRTLAWNQPKVSEAPVILVVLADRDGWKKEHPFVERNFREMVREGMPEDRYEWFTGACQSLYGASEERRQAFACKNAGFFAMNLMLAATSLGLDTHPMDGFDHEGVRNALNIPENYWIPLLLAVGYFDTTKELLPPKWRKSYEEIVVRFP
ncbi:nitroreductase family protein [Thermodesulfobacteriota bacterium]